MCCARGAFGGLFHRGATVIMQKLVMLHTTHACCLYHFPTAAENHRKPQKNAAKTVKQLY